MTNTDTIGPFRFSVQSVAAAERILGKKLSEILVEIESDGGMALRTLLALTAAGSPPSGGPSGLWDSVVDNWIDQAANDAARLVRRHGTGAVAAAVGPAFGAFLASIQ